MYEIAVVKLLPIMFIAGIFSGVVDAIVGCGSFITIPVMFFTGIPPHIAIGTNKIQGSIGTFYALYCYYKEGLIKIKSLITPIFVTAIFAVLGSIAIKFMPEKEIEKLLPLITLILLIYKLKNFHYGTNNDINKKESIKVSKKSLMIFVSMLVGFYDGFFGPAAGTIWISVLIAFFGYNLLQASAESKVFNFIGNIASLPIFLMCANFDYKIATTMIFGQIIGTKIGVYLSMKYKEKFINIMFIFAISILTVILFFKYW